MDKALEELERYLVSAIVHDLSDNTIKTAIQTIKELKEYKDLGLTVENIKEIDRLYSEQAKELMEYRKAEKEGLLLRLPCRIGETIYWINNWRRTYGDLKIDTEKAVGYRFDGEKMLIYLGVGKTGIFKETVFLTKSEAEAKLKELEGEE